MDAASYRRVLVVSVAALAAVTLLVLVLSPSGDEVEIPAPIEAVFPLPGDTVVRQTAIEVDLPVGYTLELIVDGVRVPPFEIGFTQPTGRFIWQPGPTSSLPPWTPGTHEVTIRWDRSAGGAPDPGTFTWTFRVT